MYEMAKVKYTHTVIPPTQHTTHTHPTHMYSIPTLKTSESFRKGKNFLKYNEVT